MTRRKKRTAAYVALVSLLLTACAGRTANPVSLTSTTDTSADCAMLQAEASVNAQRINDLTNEQEFKLAQNVFVGVAGMFLVAPLMLIDVQDAPGVEKKALQARNQYVATLAAKRCDPSAAQTVEKTVAAGEKKDTPVGTAMRQWIEDVIYTR
ncbi:MAG: hypothetical protein U1E42_02490 [Rhodospirillales bacterium]